MAHCRPVEEPDISLKGLVLRVGRRVLVGPVLDLAAQVAFYAVLALAPFLVVLTSLAAFLPSPDSVSRLLSRLRGFMPTEAFELVQRVVADVVERRSATLLTVGLLTAVWSASRAANALGLALNDAHGLTDGRSWVRRQLVAIVITLEGAGLLLLSVVAALAGASLVEDAAGVLGLELGARTAVWGVLRWPIAVVSLVAVAALSFRVLPDTRPRPKAVWLGAAVATVLFLVSSRLFAFYAEHFADFGVTYGSLTGGVLLLLWAWLSAVAFIVGGEVVAAFPGARPRRAVSASDTNGEPAAAEPLDDVTTQQLSAPTVAPHTNARKQPRGDTTAAPHDTTK